MRVALIPTGKLELLGLAEALRRAFPAHEFHCVPFSGNDPFRSFTSAPLPLPSLHQVDSSLSELIGGIVDQLYPTPTSDLVVVLDDLEICNQGNETTVVEEFRQAVTRHLQRVQIRAPMAVMDIQKRLRESASFHLAAPMIESWLFADPDGPAKALAPATHLPPKLRHGHDPEDFETTDPNYSADTGQCCTTRNALPLHAQESTLPEWLKRSASHAKVKIRRETHPKRYMAWLCRSPTERNCSTYSVRTGAEALKQLAWDKVMETPGHMRFLRSLLFDLANALGCAPTAFSLNGDQADLTSLRTPRSLPVLRNI